MTDSTNNETTLKQRLRADLTVAMRAADSTTLATLRMALTAVTNAEVGGDVARDLTDDEVVAVLVAESRKRLDAAEAYSAAGRPDRAAEEQAEYDVLARYLPATLSDSELDAIVAEEVAKAAAAGSTGMKAMGAVVKAVRDRAGATVDGSLVAAKVRSALSS